MRAVLLISLPLILIASSFGAEAPTRKPTCGNFPEQLKACEPVTCLYKHLLTREVLQRQIFGKVKGKCVYSEKLPEGKLLSCRLEQEDLRPLARHYRIFDGARDIEMIPKVNSKTGEGVLEVRVDGQVASDILDRLIARGDCKVTPEGSKP